MPSAVFVQTGEACQPEIVAIIHPSVGFGQFTVNGKGSHCEDTEVHLPYMVVVNEVLQTVVIHLKQVVSVFFYMLQKQLASGVIQ